MYLKSIEVHGFKSFANKILFEFHNGITGIVGPNGSGKSNVADAVRWVLGEQSVKQLRGASMQDVIFAGTQNRKPLGYAYVAITLDNSDHSLAIDYDEVVVARRLYRSGESEYLLNGTVCRLKDVNELFYDTGIGKEGYSIIGQGQIDKILSGKPEERRELFDEAAGIVKFKRRKNEAVKRLEHEKQNLLRVNDILAEIEGRKNPLEKQSDKAKTYLRKKETLKNLDVNVFLLENEKLVNTLAETGEKYDEASEQLEEANNSFSHIKDEYEKVASNLERLEEMITEGQNKISSASEIRSKLELQIGVLKEQIRAAGDNKEHFVNRQNAINEQLAEREEEKNKVLEEKKSYDLELESMEKVLSGALSRVTSLQQQMDGCNEKIEESNSSIIEGLNQRGAIKSEIARLDSLKEQSAIRRSELSARLLRARSDEEEHETEIASLREVFEKVSKEITGLNETQSKLEEKNSELTEELSGKDQMLRDTQVKYHEAKSKLEAIKGISERYEGYGNSIRRVMEQKEQEKGIIGVVADIIKVDPKYETAIETALGGNIQNIVTEDEPTAKKMIELLKRERAGRATFLPLTSITKPQEFKTPEVLDEKGVIALACDLVQIDKKYSNVAKTLLGRIVVVENVDLAFRIAKKFDYGVRIVTLEGELLVPGGAVSGGAFKHSGNLLARRREMTDLEESVKGFLRSIDELLSDIEKAKEERKGVRRQIEETRELIQKKFIEQNTARLNVMTAQEKKDQAGAGMEQLKEEAGELEKTLAELDQQREEASEKLKESEAKEKECQKIIEENQSLLDELAVQETEASDKVARIRTETEVCQQKQQFMQQNVDRITADIQRVREELEEVVRTLEQAGSDVKQKEEDIEKLTATIEASYSAQDEDREKLEEYQKKKQEMTEKQKNFFKEREELSDKISTLDKEVYRLGAQKERMQETIDNRISYMWEEYEITLSDAASLKDEEMTDLGGMKKEIATLKDEIKSLGDVNVNAIEEYRELMERYTFLSNQHDDLIEAEEQLRKLIEDLDENMRTQFTEKFGQICVEFDKVFKEMFGGGQGSLELQEEEDVLEAGIRITAQPPGKKLQNMMQLSGGEKALTAIALLFAIQNLKPSPFCLLDEIEAALDDSNVGRFAGYLHKLTRHTQFIVITHRRGTMERADRLYGITMQEKGVSALVSVDLIEKELDKMDAASDKAAKAAK
ncbi:MAG: chromosome segregation protein SMC [Lachnospiraceae bacterium]|nr:chromosome segregation protein SMC [Lachnospiraceae bacterium]